MALTWMEKLAAFFGTAKVEPVQGIVEVKAPVKEKTDFEKVIDQFNFRTDMIAISEERLKTLTKDERDWLDSLGDKVNFFTKDSLVNIAIIRAM